jgi:hypothetical protein
MASCRVGPVVLVATALAVSVAPAHPAPAAPPKKCAMVVKRVHGKKKKVKVCPKVVNASVKLDSAHSTSFTLEPSGGSTTVTSAAGAKVTLSVPAGATQSDVGIRVTPLRSAAHLPLRSLVAGVQLEPDGLQLDQPATLTIQTPKIPKGRVIGFTYSGTGREVHPYPVGRSGTTLSFRITHFSGYGAGRESDAARIALVQSMLAEWTSIVTKLPLASVDTSFLPDSGILSRYWAWVKSAQAYGFPELVPYIVELRKQALQAVRSAVARAESSCRGNGSQAPLHELEPTFDVLRAYELAETLGLSEILDPAARLELLRQCLTFELDFDTVITWTVEGGQAISHVRSEKLRLDWANRWQAQQPLDYVSFSFLESPDCSITLDPHADEPFGAKMPLMDNVYLRGDDARRITTDVDVGRASETITVSCPHGATVTGTAYYYDGIYVFHNFMPTFTIADWSVAGGSVFATRDYTGTFQADGGTISEQTHFVLRHVPQ